MTAQTKVMLIIADDLTGANDTAVQLARQGFQTEVFLEGFPLNPLTDSAIAVIDTNSRAICPAAAYSRVQAAARQGLDAGFGLYYKKMDSTLRGNIGKEIMAILDLSRHDFAFVMPAFPQNGRTTVGGQCLLHGVPLSATEIAQDPRCPVRETSLPELLRQQTNAAVGHIGVQELVNGQAAITPAIQRHLTAGCQIISVDAWCEDHFILAAKAALAVSGKILWAGSAALAAHLPALFNWKADAHKDLPPLVISGTVSSVTRKQINELLLTGYELIEWDAADFLPWHPPAAKDLLQRISANIARGKKLILASGYQPEAVERAQSAGSTIGMTAGQVSETVAQILGWLGAAMLSHQEIPRVVLTGGDTAAAVCRALGVSGINILEEIAPAIPLGEMSISNGRKLRVVTKAGAFGDSNALVLAVQKLQQRK